MKISEAQSRAAKLYGELMGEVRIRLLTIAAATSGAYSMPSQVVRELCYLQLRLITELIALACLVAHGDLDVTANVKKEFAADKIMKALEALHPKFFPEPLRPHTEEVGGVLPLIMLEDRLSKADLLKIYFECGDHLHKGSLKKLLKTNSPVEVKFSDLLDKAQKINGLLEEHRIVVKGEEVIYFCSMNYGDSKQQVSVAIATRN